MRYSDSFCRCYLNRMRSLSQPPSLSSHPGQKSELSKYMSLGLVNDDSEMNIFLPTLQYLTQRLAVKSPWKSDGWMLGVALEHNKAKFPLLVSLHPPQDIRLLLRRYRALVMTRYRDENYPQRIDDTTSSRDYLRKQHVRFVSFSLTNKNSFF